MENVIPGLINRGLDFTGLKIIDRFALVNGVIGMASVANRADSYGYRFFDESSKSNKLLIGSSLDPSELYINPNDPYQLFPKT